MSYCRVLVQNSPLHCSGKIIIAEVSSRITSDSDVGRNLKVLGFELCEKVADLDYFRVFTFVKRRSVSKSVLSGFSTDILGPCLYKKR